MSLSVTQKALHLGHVIINFLFKRNTTFSGLISVQPHFLKLFTTASITFPGEEFSLIHIYISAPNSPHFHIGVRNDRETCNSTCIYGKETINVPSSELSKMENNMV